MAAIYQADIWCDDCAEKIKDRIWVDSEEYRCWIGRNKWEVSLGFDDERNYDSGDYPKWCDDDEESDCPEHCAAGADCVNPSCTSDGEKYGYFFGNNLTSDGDDYVRETVNENRREGRNDSPAVELWAPCYDYIDYGPEDQCATCGDYAELDENDECECCSEEKPCDGDFTVTPCGLLGGLTALGRVEGEFIGEFDDDAAAVSAAKRIMTEEQFWPNIWLVSDHGNWTLYEG